jgi:PAS domain S-box-containing protein
VTRATQAILFNGLPLFVLAAAYLGVFAALAPTLWQERRRASVPDLALASIFPGLGIPALIWATAVTVEGEPIAGNVWLPLVGIVIALLPALVFLLGWSDRVGTLLAPVRAREAEEKASLRGREITSVAVVSSSLVGARDTRAVAESLLRAVLKLDFQFAGMALVDEALTEARAVLALTPEGETQWFGTTLDLVNEPSGVASAIREAAPVTIFDAEGSPVVSRRLVEGVGAKSAAFVPMISGDRVLGALAVATTVARRAFDAQDVALLQALAGEAALALERIRSEEELQRAAERERLVARIGMHVRSELDVDAVMRVAVAETAAALGLSRCAIRLGDPGADVLAAEWHAPGLEPIGPLASRLPVTNLAARTRETAVVNDVASATDLDDETLGGRETLLELGTRSALSTPMFVFDDLVGIFILHRAEAGDWDESEIALAEAVAREVGLAIRTARLLRENEERLKGQAALLEAAQVVTSELELDALIQRLVDEVAALLHAPSADCYLFDPVRRTLRCAAVHGLDVSLVGFEFSAERGVAGQAIARGRVTHSHAYENVEPVPHDAYEGFATALVAPMVWGGVTRGVLGVGLRPGERAFSQADADVLEAFAGLASLALRNAESFRERSRQARIQRGFYRIATVLGQSLSLAETLDAVAHASAEALDGIYAAVLLPRAAGLQLAASQGLPEQLAQRLQKGLTPDSTAFSAATRDRRLVSSSAVRDDDRFGDEWRSLAESVGYGALLAIPIEQARSMTAGLVIVFFADERTFTEEDLELARHLAEATRGALERSDLFETERSSRALAQQFARTSALLATELDPAAVLDEVVEQAPALLGVEAAAIRVLEGDELVVRTVEGVGAEAAIGSRTPTSGFLAGDVVQSRLPVAIADAGDDARYRDVDPMLAAGHSAYLGVPLVGTEGNLLGVLSVYAREARAWRDEEVEALAALAGNASAALSNAELYQRVAVEKERNEAILANVADGIVAVDRDGKVVLWNAAAEQITNVPQSEALGRTPDQVLGRTLASEGTDGGPSRLVSILRGGEEAWLSLSEAVMRDPGGLVAGRIFAFRDISSERLVEQMKSDFVSTVSQQLRTPLTSIYGFAETLLRSDVLFGEEERRTFLGYIASESERLTSIVDNLLNVARLDTGDLKVQLAPTEVRAVVSEAVTGAQEAVTQNGHHFVVDLPTEPITAEADRDKLRQIVSILVDNAVKYSPDGGTVTVAARQKQDTVEVRVEDQGVGIPPAEQQRIFTKFYRRGFARADAVAGTGLGLFIAQGLVTAMGGRIWVDSREGEGSQFVFELPLARVGAQAEA